MIILLIILGIVLLLVAGFLIAPIRVYIDTDEQRFEVSQQPVILFNLIMRNGVPQPRLRIAGLEIPLISKVKKETRPKVKKRKEKKGTHKSRSAWNFLIKRTLGSFEIKQLILDVDTDNTVLNAQLVPIFLMVSGRLVHLSSNFEGRVYFHLDIQNRLSRMLGIFILFLTKK